jgi:transglutaminase-like putative cysteine protease
MQFSGFSPARLLSALLVSVLALGTAQARDDGTDLSITIEKEIQTNVVNADGSFVATWETAYLINEERAIKAWAQRSMSYNRTLETLEVVQAYTQKPDGRKVQVQADQIKEQQEQASAGAPMFQDTLLKVVIFPEVAVGDRLVVQFKKKRSTALFPGHFEDLSYPAFFPTRQFTLIYDLPADMPLHADAKGFTASTPAAGPGRKIYRWDYVPAQKARIEQGAVSYLDYGQYLAVSTFSDFATFAKAYDARAHSTLTPQIQDLANGLAAGLDTPRAKAIALSDWVRKNIRYVAVYVGPGGVVPHPVDTILANRYGDCKDHVALLEAMLAAVGIESSPALVNLGNAYVLPKVPTLGLLNHAITYVPSLNLYLDSTAEGIAAGYLPVPVLDKPVVLSKSGSVGHTPALQEGLVENSMLFKVSSKGAAEFSHTSNVIGWAAEVNRYGVKSMKPADRDLMIQQILASYGLNGSGTFDAGKFEESGQDYAMSMAGRVENLVNLPGPIGVLTMSSLAGGIAQSVFGLLMEPERTQAFTCISGVTEEQARFEFPQDVSILAAPKNVTLSHERFDYSSTYVREGNTVVVKRRFDFKQPGAVCTPDDFKSMKTMAEAAANDLKSQIIVQLL